MKKYIFIAPLFALFVFIQQTQTIFGTTYFTRNLRLGTTGADVFELQKALNTSPDTRVASAGAGSPGSETTYFGYLTRGAVIRFQEKYKSEVLIPAGVAQGTGFVGEFTRKKLNSMQNTAQNNAQIPVQLPTLPAQTTPPAQTPATTTNISTAPHIDSISPTSGIDGTAITIHGSNFAATNTILAGWGTYENVASSDGRTLIITVKSNIPDDKKIYVLPVEYHITVKSDKQVSNDTLFTLLLDPSKEPLSQTEKDVYKQKAIDYLKQNGYVFSQ